MRHEGEGLQGRQQGLLQLAVLSEGPLALQVRPGNVVHAGKRHALLLVHAGNAAVLGVAALRAPLGRQAHELHSNVDDVAAVRVALRGLKVNAADHAGDGGLHVGHAQVVEARPRHTANLLRAAVLQGGHAGHQVVVREAAGKAGTRDAVQPLRSVLVAHLAVAVRQAQHQAEGEGLLAKRRLPPLVHQQGYGLLVLLALRRQGRVGGEEAG